MKIQNALKKVLDKVDLKEVEMVSIMTQIMVQQLLCAISQRILMYQEQKLL